MLAKVRDQGFDRRGFQLGGACFGSGRFVVAHQVVRQDDSVAFLDRSDLVSAVSVEGDEGKALTGAAVNHLLALVLDQDRAAPKGGRQRDDQGPEHVVGLL